MIIFRLLRFFWGSVTVFARSSFLERFLNLCTHAGIKIYRVERHSREEMDFTVPARQFKKLRPIAHRTKTRLRITEKRGFPFLVRRYRKRYALAAGVLLFLAALAFMSCFIWSIDVSGNVEVSDEEILAQLAEEGFVTGIYAGNLDLDTIYQNMLIKNDRLAWIAINIKGSKAFVEVKERVMAPEFVDRENPYDIFARSDGVITALKGQLLVAGTRTNQFGEMTLHASEAKILAQTARSFKTTVPQIKQEEYYTGEVEKKRTLRIFGLPIKLFLNSGISAAEYDKITNEYDVSIGGQLYLPIQMEVVTYKEKEVFERTLTREEQLLEARGKIGRFAEQKLRGMEVLDSHESVVDNGDSITVRITYDCVEDIGERVRIYPADMPEQQPAA